ncbi:hypothetical protein C8R44DRAFT_888756 [Mycena epipterygia]|nr:hypothetical protein C8R44DRAFT_888756 [Mycena epipterygia]
MGYFQCMYALNATQSKFTKLFHTVFPYGLEDPSVSAMSPSRTLRTSTSVSGLSLAGLSISGSSGSSSPAYASANTLGRLGLVLREPGAQPAEEEESA